MKNKLIIAIPALLIIYVMGSHLIGEIMVNKMRQNLVELEVSNDGSADIYISDFKRITGKRFNNGVRFAKHFPDILDVYDVGINEFVGYAFGLDDDSTVDVWIDKSEWEDMDVNVRRALIYHELSHDVLNINHVDYDECHLMYPTMNDCSILDLDDKLKKLIN